MNDTFNRLVNILLKTYAMEPSMITPNLSLDAMGVDSLGIGLLLFDVEDEFKLKFTRDPGRLKTLGDVARYVDEVIAEQRGNLPLGATSLPVA